LEIIDGKEDREPFLSQVLSTTTTFFRCLIFPTRWGDLLLRKAELESPILRMFGQWQGTSEFCGRKGKFGKGSLLEF
jgi:hypothetical protein